MARTAEIKRKEPRGKRAQLMKRRLLDNAEELFAERGFYGVTLKEIAEKVGVDTALLHYYFGNKQTLFEDVLTRRATILNEERLSSLEEYEAEAAGNYNVEEAISAFVKPLFSYAAESRGWKNYFRLVAQINTSSVWGGEIMTKHFEPVIKRFIETMSKALPGVPESSLYWGFQMLTPAITLSLSETGRIDHLSGGQCRSLDLATVMEKLIRYSAAGFLALASDSIGATESNAARSRHSA